MSGKRLLSKININIQTSKKIYDSFLSEIKKLNEKYENRKNDQQNSK